MTQKLFLDAFNAYYEGDQRIHATDNAKPGPKSAPEQWRVDWLQQRVRVVQGDSSRSWTLLKT
jgi:hypothetical protein